MASGSSLGAHGCSRGLPAKIYQNHDLYPAAFKIHENHCSVDFWIEGQKIIKSSFLELVLSISGANARKSSNRAFLDWFSRCLEPKPKRYQIEFPGVAFVGFLIRGWKVVKSSLLGLVLSTSGAKARKSSNQPSWD